MAENTQGLFLLWAIVEKGNAKEAEKVLEERGVHFEVFMLGSGTARTEFLQSLGIADIERALVLAPVRAERKDALLTELAAKLHLEKRGAGILFSLPITAVGGPQTLKLFRGDPLEETDGQDTEAEACRADNPAQEEKSMSEPKAELVITIVQRGYGSDVVDSAARAGARGGTVLRGRASGGGDTQRFFGIMVEPQKDVVLLVIPRAIKADVMRAICRDLGLKTPGAGVSFSLPVLDVVGAYGFDDPDFVAGTEPEGGKKKRRLSRGRSE